jgi:dynein light chain 1
VLTSPSFTSQTTCTAAIKAWEAKHEQKSEEATVVKLYCQLPPIAKMDNSLNSLASCEHLALSTNCIDRMIPLSGMKCLRILSLGRNAIKKIEKLEDVAETLEELWISYNQVRTIRRLGDSTSANRPLSFSFRSLAWMDCRGCKI